MLFLFEFDFAEHRPELVESPNIGRNQSNKPSNRTAGDNKKNRLSIRKFVCVLGVHLTNEREDADEAPKNEKKPLKM